MGFAGYSVGAVVSSAVGVRVYAATRDSDRRAVLIVVPADPAAPEDAVERLHHEYGLRERLDSAWALRPLQLGRTEEGIFLVREGCSGRPLAERTGAPMPIEELLVVAVALASALDGLHARQLIHRDVQPDHLYWDAEAKRVWLTGFGLTSAGLRELPAAAREQASGSLAYVSPEQTGRLNRPVDPRSDLYSLGVVLYQLLTGELPGRGRDAMEWVHWHLASTPLPPHAVVPGLPEVLGAIVLKLLEKDADDRYQTAAGLRADLERCLGAWRATGELEPFTLGCDDVSGQLRLPLRLYGRERELELLAAAFRRVVASGKPEVVLVEGYSGVGKTSLVEALRPYVAREWGLFLSGKFDQYQHDAPYAPLVRAFQQLVSQILTESEARVAAWRAALLEALGVNGRIMVEIIPQIELVIGPQPPVADLPPSEALLRFQRVVRQFVAVFAKREHPLVLFIDDLQWVDPASLELLRHLVTAPELRHLLVVGAYRDNEVTPGHPLFTALTELRRLEVPLCEVLLTPLAAAELVHLVAAVLRLSEEDAWPLTRVVVEKTGGNPFFVFQFLGAVRQAGLLEFDAAARRWRFDLEAIRRSAFSANVVELMIEKLRGLPEGTQELLGTGACIGQDLDLHTLAGVCGRTSAAVADALRPVVQDGLLHRSEDRFTFGHDRIQQAAYALVAKERRPALHLAIGRYMAERTPAHETAERVFDVLGQLNRALGLIEDPDERRDIAELELAAAKRAIASTAYESAIGYLTAGMALLGHAAWTEHVDLACALQLEWARCEWLAGRAERAEDLLEEVRLATRSKAQRARTYALLEQIYETRGAVPLAVRAALDALELYGVSLDPHPAPELAAAALERVWARLGDRPIASLGDLPPAEDDDVRQVLELFAILSAPANYSDRSLFLLQACLGVELCLERGISDAAAAIYTSMAMALVPIPGRMRAAYEFGKLSYAMVVERGIHAQRAKTCLVFGNIVNFWMNHVRTDLPYVEEGLAAGIETGDLAYASYCINHGVIIRLVIGDELARVTAEAEKALAFVRRAGLGWIADIQSSIQRLVAALRGETRGVETWDGPGFDEAAFIARVRASGVDITTCWCLMYLVQTRVLAGAHRDALALLEQVDALLWTSSNQLVSTEYTFYAALALAGAADELDPEARAQAIERLAGLVEQLRAWAADGPETFGYKLALTSAELARLQGDVARAEVAYEQALAAARRDGFVQGEGLAGERAAAHYRARGLETPARAYLREAAGAWSRWGAAAKVHQLEQKNAWMVPAGSRAGAPVSDVRLDTIAIVKASQALSGQLQLSTLLEELMRTMVQSAGAERGVLVLDRLDRRDASTSEPGAEAWIEAASDVAGRIHEPLAGTSLLPVSLVLYALRTKERVILEDATARPLFAADPYIVRQRPRAALCLPIVRQAEVIGALYLENRLVAGVFTEDRVQVLELLASQAAISLENAILFDERQASADALRELNATLEQRVAARTAELATANEDLKSFSYSVSHDLRAPLRAIEGFGRALKNDAEGQLGPDAQRNLDRVLTATKTMARLIDDILSFARLARQEMRPSWVDLSAVAVETIEDLVRSQPERVVDVRIARGLQVYGDAHMLRTALENLLGNAWKYTGRHARAKIELGATVEDGETVYFVRDDGAGFDMTYAGKLFTPFRRLHTPAEFPGTGIGLANVERVVRRHNGRIWADAAPEQGATFYFTLALPPPSKEERPAEPADRAEGADRAEPAAREDAAPQIAAGGIGARGA